MRAHLARHACRRLFVQGNHLPSRSILLSQSLRQLPPSAPVGNRAFRRTFFGIFQKAPRKIKQPEFEPGWTAILTWRNRQLDHVRPPSRKELVDAFREFFVYKLRFNVTVNSTQARHCKNLMQYIVDDPLDENGPGLTLIELTAAREALLKLPRENKTHHLEFSKALYTEIQKERRKQTEKVQAVPPAESASGRTNSAVDLANEDFKSYLVALSQFGAALEARDILTAYWARLHETQTMYKGAKALWIIVLRGLAKEGSEKELLELAKTAETCGIEYMPPFHEVMTTFYATRDRVEETKCWFEKPIYGKWPATAASYSQILRFSVRNNLQEWSKHIFQTLCDSNPRKAWWDVVFQWAALAMGKGVDDIKHMFEVMTRHNQEDSNVLPDIDTINGLIRVAIEKKDQYLAERFLSLGAELGMRPNARTYIHQIEYRIDAGDAAGAMTAYEKLQHTEVQGEEDLPAINKFIRAVCSSKPPNFDILDELLADIQQRIVTLEPETVSTLCVTFLENDRQFDVIDILSLNVIQYSLEQRDMVIEAFVKYCLDGRNSTARVWDAYSLLRQYFLEILVEDRVRLMEEFFRRKRPDMAIHVFGHMRQHAQKAFHPTMEAYASCFEGLSRCLDLESLRLVYNMLKMDTTIQPNTKLYNSLMLAFVANDRPAKALEIWQNIVNSVEGPSYSSLDIIFWACERLPFSISTAREIWDNIQSMEVDVPPSVFAAYIGSVASSGNLEEVKGLLQRSPNIIGWGPDANR
jgi:hypothetical protein